MKSILVTGLAIGSEPEINTCSACNYDLSWLFTHPSTLLWADKIVLTEGIKQFIDDESFPYPEKPELAKGIKLIFDMLADSNLLEVRRAADVISPSVRQSLYEEIELDRRLISEVFASDAKLVTDSKIPGQFVIRDHEYCTPALWSVYASLHLADAWDTNVLFSPSVYNYLRYKFGLHPRLLNPTAEVAAFEKVFSSFLPESPLLPDYFIGSSCDACGKVEKCRDHVLPSLETNVRNILAWRDYDEFHEMRSVFSDLSKRRKECVNPSELIADFSQHEAKLQKRINGIFPKIERWTNLASVVAIPVALGGVTAGSSTLATTAGAVAGLAEIGKKYLDIAKSRYRWVGFRNNHAVQQSSKKRS